MPLFKSALLCVTPLLILASVASAAEKNPSTSTEQCSNLLQECFMETDARRASCFYALSQHRYCKGSELGKQILKRWELSSGTSPDGTPLFGFLGSSTYDKQCLSDCDLQWRGLLIQKSIDISSGAATACYEQCRREVAQRDLPLP